MPETISTKNILEVDTIVTIDPTDTVFVNDGNTLKQVSVIALVSSGIPDEYITKTELNSQIETTDAVEKDNTLPVTSAGVYTVCGNIEALLQAL